MKHTHHLTAMINARLVGQKHTNARSTIQIDSVTAEKRDLLKVPSQLAKLPIHLLQELALMQQGE